MSSHQELYLRIHHLQIGLLHNNGPEHYLYLVLDHEDIKQPLQTYGERLGPRDCNIIAHPPLPA